MKKREESLQDLWEYIKRTNVRIIRIPKEEEYTFFKTHYNKTVKNQG